MDFNQGPGLLSLAFDMVCCIFCCFLYAFWFHFPRLLLCLHVSGKGDVLGVARVAGIMAAKRTWELIPLCHPLPLGKCTVDFTMLPEELAVEVRCTVRVAGQTGVEMEALTGATVALLTIYDMCKAMDKGMEIQSVYLLRKTGGKSGDFMNPKHGEETP